MAQQLRRDRGSPPDNGGSTAGNPYRPSPPVAGLGCEATNLTAPPLAALHYGALRSLYGGDPAMEVVGIFGREAELAALRSLVSGVATGRGGVGWVQGEPGIGKSMLLDVVAAEAAAAGVAVSRGGGEELMEAFPLRVMAGCLGVDRRSADPVRAQIAGLLRGEAGSVQVLDPVLAAGERMLELVDRLAADGPVLVAVEDLHWADEPSLRLWNRLSRAVNQIPLLLLGTCRPVPSREVVSRLRAAAQERGGVVVDLGPLSEPSVAELAGRLAGGAPGPRLSAELKRAGGNPLYVRELVNALLLDDLVEVSGQVAEVRAGALTPGSLTRAIGRRLSFLSAHTAEVLRLAALLGAEFDAGELAVVTGRSVVELSEPIREAVTAGVVTDRGRRLMFRHELIRDVLEQQTPASARAASHGRFARVLADADAGMDAVARHLMAVPGGLEPWAVRWLADVPESLLYAAPQVSADLLARAVALLPEDDPRRQQLACRLVQVLFWLGRDEEVRQVADAVLRHADDAETFAQMTLLAARAAGRMTDFEHNLALFAKGLEHPGLSPTWRARLMVWQAKTYVYVGSVDEGRAVGGVAFDEASRAGDAIGRAYALGALAKIPGEPAQLERIERALEGLGTDPDAMDQRLLLLQDRIRLLSLDGRRDDTIAATREALVLAEGVGTYYSVALHAAAATSRLIFGDWDDTLTHIASIDPEYLATPGLSGVHGGVAMIAVHRGDLEQARDRLRAAGHHAPYTPEDLQGRNGVTPAAALLVEAEGDPARALAVWQTWFDVPPGPDREGRYEELLHMVRLGLQLDDRAAAQAAVAAAVAECEARVSPPAYNMLVTRCCKAMFDDDAAELLSVGEDLRRLGFAVVAGYADEEAAVRLAAAGEVAAARKAFTRAVRGYHDRGGVWDVRRADARLRPYGIRRGSRTLHRRAATGWEALTPGERRVAELVADGMSNPDIAAELFLSRNTVQTHVSNVLTKLRLRSRAELIRVGAPEA